MGVHEKAIELSEMLGARVDNAMRQERNLERLVLQLLQVQAIHVLLEALREEEKLEQNGGGEAAK